MIMIYIKSCILYAIIILTIQGLSLMKNNPSVYNLQMKISENPGIAVVAVSIITLVICMIPLYRLKFVMHGIFYLIKGSPKE